MYGLGESVSTEVFKMVELNEVVGFMMIRIRVMRVIMDGFHVKGNRVMVFRVVWLMVVGRRR